METIKNISIQTITPTYDQIEDRIRLSFNYQDINNRIDMMLTRAFLLKILPSIEEYIYQHYPNEEIENQVNIQTDTSLEEKIGSSQELSKTSMEDLTLYQTQTYLLFTLNLNFDKNTQLTFMKFISKDKHTASLSVDIKILKNILFSIKSAIPTLNWGISGHF